MLRKNSEKALATVARNGVRAGTMSIGLNLGSPFAFADELLNCRHCHMIHDRQHYLARRWITYLLHRALGDLFFGLYSAFIEVLKIGVSPRAISHPPNPRWGELG
jgi:hypothetical protein